MTKGMYPEALAAAEKAISMEPDYSSAYQTRGFILLNVGRYSEAKEAFRQAIAIDNNLCLTNLYLAAIYSREGNHILAQQHCNKAKEDNCEVKYELEQELKQIGLQCEGLIY
ncbi:MAG: hypothetical protein A2166_06735 [Omnitrophica WOR_2 bacterium RBG_13_41_10]|nr:MAG: hypothetical protein A2166_06735 [Omnitrophica WOR_2 bacterium RBG_13_41_10]